MDETDILIVGAGPSGLMMATALAQYDLRFRIIDKAKAPSDKSKAIAIQARTLEILDHLDIANLFISAGLQIKATNLFSQQKRIAHISLKQLESPYPFVLTLEQSKTEKILENHLLSSSITVEREVELVSFDQKKDGIYVILNNHRTNKEEHLKTSWMIGCDGAHSLIRKKLDLSFQGKVFSDIFSLADIHLDWEYPHDELFVFLESKGVMAIFPLPDRNRYRLIFQLQRCKDLLKKISSVEHGLVQSENIAEPTLKEAQKMLDCYVGVQAVLKDPIWMANFHINSRLSSHYRKERIFLVGDAAHIHSPVGGQGMNTGMQDAFNLAWKLAYTIQNKTNKDLLNSYQMERHTVGKILLKATERASFLATLHNRYIVFLRNHIARWLLKKPWIQKKLIQAISETGIRYLQKPSSHCSFQRGPKVGLRAPNVLFTLHEKTVDLFSLRRKKTTYSLLVFTGLTPIDTRLDTLHDFLQIHAKDPCIQSILIMYHIQDIFPSITVHDPSKDAHKVYGAEKGALYVIRPDGYICYRQPLTKNLKVVF